MPRLAIVGLVVGALLLCVGRLFVPTIGHSWPAVFTALAHIYVGVIATLLWRRRGRWRLGWLCLLAPSLLEAAMFLAWAPAQAAEMRPASAPTAHHRFGGKFELVPLFERGRPMLRNGHSYYAVRNPLAFRTDAGEVLQVYGGQTTDLASIPPAIWPLLPPDGPWAEAAAFHDVCYRSHGSMGFPPKHVVGRAQPFDRAGCDEILREAMVALGVPAWKRVTIWASVRVGGGAGWGH